MNIDYKMRVIGPARHGGKLGYESIMVVPFKEFGRGLINGIGRGSNGGAVVAVVVAAVVELLFDAAADFDVHVRGDGDVSFVKQGVEVAAE